MVEMCRGALRSIIDILIKEKEVSPMKFVDYRVEDNIAHVVMNRGPVNALSTELVDEILKLHSR